MGITNHKTEQGSDPAQMECLGEGMHTGSEGSGPGRIHYRILLTLEKSLSCVSNQRRRSNL